MFEIFYLTENGRLEELHCYHYTRGHVLHKDMFYLDDMSYGKTCLTGGHVLGRTYHMERHVLWMDMSISIEIIRLYFTHVYHLFW